MIIEFESRDTNGTLDYWGFDVARGLYDRRYDRAVQRGPFAYPGLWFAYGTGKVMPGRATVRFTLARGVSAPVDSGPTSQADAQNRYSILQTRLLPGANVNLWVCTNDGTRLWGRQLYGAHNVRLVSTESAAWYYVEADIELEGHYMLWDTLETDDGRTLTTDGGETLYVRLYRG